MPNPLEYKSIKGTGKDNLYNKKVNNFKVKTTW